MELFSEVAALLLWLSLGAVPGLLLSVPAYMTLHSIKRPLLWMSAIPVVVSVGAIAFYVFYETYRLPTHGPGAAGILALITVPVGIMIAIPALVSAWCLGVQFFPASPLSSAQKFSGALLGTTCSIAWLIVLKSFGSFLRW
jgi:hypothetical protein